MTNHTEGVKGEETEALVVGAGLSAFFGYALNGEILPTILRRMSKGTLFYRVSEDRSTDLRNRLRNLLEDFLPGIYEKSSESPSITDILSLTDYLIGNGEAVGRSLQQADLLDMRLLLELAVLEVITTPLRPIQAAKTRTSLINLANWIIEQGLQGRPVSIITTNYDFVLESILYKRLAYYEKFPESCVDYGFSWRHTASGHVKQRPDNPLIRILKLHGSVNWLRCRLCGFIYINPNKTIYHHAAKHTLKPANTCHCTHGPLAHVMVAPSSFRNPQEIDLRTVWRSALESLRNASKWCIVGYSMPTEDLAIRSTLLRALRGRRSAPSVEIFETNTGLEGRFRTLFPKCQFIAKGAEAYIAKLHPTNAAVGQRN